jgi:WD40 repeat protein
VITPAPTDMVRTSLMCGVMLVVLALGTVACGGESDESAGGAGGETAGSETTPSETTQEEASGAERYTLPGEEVFPEGVAYRPETGDFFVGSTTDGTVFQGNVEGDSEETEVFLEPGSDGRQIAIGMEVDEEGRLFIAGGDTGTIFVYDVETGDLVSSLHTPEAEATFLNDVAVTPNGDAFVTDSMRPVLFRVTSTPDGVKETEPWLDFGGTSLEYEEGFNANGIDATENGRYLIVVQSNTGELFRIDTESREVAQIDLGGETLTNGDGLLLDGRTAYIMRNEQELIVPVELSGDYTSGEVGESFTDPSLAYPTTIAKYDERLLVVNSQFDEREGEPELPFTVSDIEIP